MNQQTVMVDAQTLSEENWQLILTGGLHFIFNLPPVHR